MDALVAVCSMIILEKQYIGQLWLLPVGFGWRHRSLWGISNSPNPPRWSRGTQILASSRRCLTAPLPWDLSPLHALRAGRSPCRTNDWDLQLGSFFLRKMSFCYHFFGRWIDGSWTKIMAAMRCMSCEKKSAVSNISNILVRGQYWVIASRILPAQYIYIYMYRYIPIHVTYIISTKRRRGNSKSCAHLDSTLAHPCSSREAISP